MNKFLFCFIAFFAVRFTITGNVNSQVDKNINNFIKDISLSVYIDAYYAADTDKDRNSLLFSSLSPYRNTFGLNIAQISLKYKSDKVRSTATMHFGDIPETNWPDGTQKFIQEANIGFSPVDKLWIDLGYFLTHIGIESLPKDNFFSSYALSSYFEPFYQCGLRISYDFSEKVSAHLNIINGYNIINDDNKYKSFGLQFAYFPAENLSLTYNNILGKENTSVNGESKLLFLNNVTINYSPVKKLEFRSSIDYAVREHSNLNNPEKSADMFSFFIAGRYKLSNKIFAILRGEYYKDANGILSEISADSTWKNLGLNVYGITAGLEYRPVEGFYTRIESRYLKASGSNQNIFSDFKNHREEFIFSAGFEY